MQKLDTSTPVHVVAVAKISLDRIPQRYVDRRRPQKAEQQFAEQVIDIPVPRNRGDHGGLQGFPPRQGLQCTVEQIVRTFLQVEVFKVFSLILVWQLLPQFRVKRLGKVFFFFSRSKKVRRSPGRFVPESPRTPPHGRRRLMRWRRPHP